MILQGNDIHFSYPGETIYKGFNFEIRRGEKVVVMGESGSGKSTLFRLLLGFEEPDSGELLFEDDVLKKDILRTFRTKTAWLPQDLNLGEGTTIDVIRYPFRFKKNGTSMPADSAIKNILSDLGLDSDTLQKTFSDLSTGQRQRIGLAICILLDKPVLLLDEPTSALDESSKEKIANHLLKNSDRTIVSTSHDPWWTKRCDRIIDLDKKP